MLDIIFGENSDTVGARALRTALKEMGIAGTLYLGYPVIATADAKIFIDALLVSESHGLTVFDLSSHLSSRPTEEQLTQVSERQDQMHASLYNKLNAYRDLRKGRSLAITVNVITCHSAIKEVINEEGLLISPPSNLPDIFEAFEGIDQKLLRSLNAAIQRVSTLRPPKRRDNVTRDDSRGAILKKIEKEIANLDQWQNRGAIEYANGPQRIRGLAGSGKTVVLALKASYLHVRHPEWKIAVTFQSRSLYQQFRDLIRRFTFEQIEDEPDWSNLLILHAWGSIRDTGLYSMACMSHGVAPQDWRSADTKYGSRAFEGVCGELNAVISKQGPKKIFDVILVDEAQDFPTSFYKMIYSLIPAPHRIIWAYDDLQNLGNYEMRSEHELFGEDNHGNALVRLTNETNKPRQDIVLPVCYRNTHWALTIAHALGFGIYRPEGLIKMFDEPKIWPRIGYETIAGTLSLGSHVSVQRSADSYPRYFTQLLDSEDAIQCNVYESEEDQYENLAKSINRNIRKDELEATDILIVLPDVMTSKRTGAKIMETLASKKVSAHLAGVTTSRDQVFQPNSVAITHIFRAKGNEAPMVYIVNAEFCQSGFELSRKRNILFTAITRSRCWVRLYGVGSNMLKLKNEVDEVRNHNFELQFQYPNRKEIEHLARVHRDMSQEEQKNWEDRINTFGDVYRAVMQGELPLDAIPADLREQMARPRMKIKGKPAP